jgi:Zn-dependent alcohol dehydrogenase
VDHAFDAVGHSDLVVAGFHAARNGGSIVCVGAPPVDQAIEIRPAALLTISEKKLLGCVLGSSHSLREIPRLLDLWRAGRLDLEGLVSARRPLAEINGAADDLRAGRGIRTVLEV